MELIDRYLQAVGFWLPNRQKQDIINELSEDIRSEVDEREAELGRCLNQFEIAGILKERGRPVIVAGRYLPQQHLIGPVLFPIYNLVLKIVLICYLTPWLLVWVGMFAFSPRYRFERLHGLGLMRDWSTLWGIAIFTFGIITAVFAILERVQGRKNFLGNWNPLELPKVSKEKRKSPRVKGIADAVASCVFIVTWLAMPQFLHSVFPEIGSVFSFAPQWQQYYWPVLALMLLTLGHQAVTLSRPQWTWVRPAGQLAVTLLSLQIVYTLLNVRPALILLSPAVNQARHGDLVINLNKVIYLWLLMMVFGMLVACLVSGLQLAWQLKRRMDDRQSMAASSML
jgi:hypothetical protein